MSRNWRGEEQVTRQGVGEVHLGTEVEAGRGQAWRGGAQSGEGAARGAGGLVWSESPWRSGWKRGPWAGCEGWGAMKGVGSG